MHPTFRQMLRSATIAAVMVPWRLFPMALKGMAHCVIACAVGTVAGAVGVYAQTPRGDLHEVYRDQGINGLLVWIIGAMASAIVGLWWRSSRIEDSTRKELLTLVDKTVSSLNLMTAAQQQHTIALTELTRSVQGLHEALIRARVN